LTLEYSDVKILIVELSWRVKEMRAGSPLPLSQKFPEL
jgi:hypothetical protein